MTNRTPIAVAVALAVVFGAGHAAAAEDRSGRYTMTPANGGFVRLDTETGAVSFCKAQDGRDGQWACSVMPDSQAAMQKEIDDLKAERQVLKDEIKRLEDIVVGTRPGSDGRPGGGGGKMDLPSEQDVDKAFDYLEKMMKKFRERMRRLERSEEPGKQL